MPDHTAQAQLLDSAPVQAYALLSDDENGNKMRKLRLASFHGISKATYLLVPTPQNTSTKLPLQKKVKKVAM